MAEGGGGSGAAIGMTWDVVGETWLSAGGSSGADLQIGGIRDGESPPASACPAASSDAAGLLLD